MQQMPCDLPRASTVTSCKPPCDVFSMYCGIKRTRCEASIYLHLLIQWDMVREVCVNNKDVQEKVPSVGSYGC